MRVSAEERRSLEGVYRWRSSERYCGPVPVITLKQSVDILYCIRVLISSQSNDEEWIRHSKVFLFLFCPTDKSF